MTNSGISSEGPAVRLTCVFYLGVCPPASASCLLCSRSLCVQYCLPACPAYSVSCLLFVLCFACCVSGLPVLVLTYTVCLCVPPTVPSLLYVLSACILCAFVYCLTVFPTCQRIHLPVCHPPYCVSCLPVSPACVCVLLM
jgi:hypothetical protein